ncbi:hypothetical protein CDD81_718 [Ophiocordyceps australis]|uniref:Uncharacterized protein n=1 Tax=Ophiocordyceps australis TaxID=1399860 RepID=A0A2C5Y169_9HYPO|nr:hypothetical protein CDD81_718 [Ophiocordyceps australis]
MLHELQRPMKKSRSVAKSEDILTGPRKKSYPTWRRVRIEQNFSALNERAKQIKWSMQTLRRVALKSARMRDIHTAASLAAERVQEITQIAQETADLIEAKSALSPVHFENTWSHVRKSRQIYTEILVHEAKQSLQQYVFNAWVERATAVAKDANIARDAKSALISATKALNVAKRLGNELLDKVFKRDIIQEILEEVMANPQSQEVAIAIEETHIAYMPSHERAIDAFKREMELLDAEIKSLEKPVYSLVEGAILAKRESNTAAIVNQRAADIARRNWGAEDKVNLLSEWRKQRVRDLEQLIQEDVEARGGLQRQNIALQNSRKDIAELATQHRRRLKRARFSNRVATIILSAVPVATAPIGQALVAARQVERLITAVREVLRASFAAGVSPLVQSVEHLTSQLHSTTLSAKVAAPQKISPWIRRRSPRKVIARLKAMEKVGVKPSVPLADLMRELEDVEIPSGEPGEELYEMVEKQTAEKPEDKTDGKKEEGATEKTRKENAEDLREEAPARETEEEAGEKAERQKSKGKRAKVAITTLMETLEGLEAPLFSRSHSSTESTTAALGQFSSMDQIIHKLEITSKLNATDNPDFWLLLDEAVNLSEGPDKAPRPRTMMEAIYKEMMRNWKKMQDELERDLKIQRAHGEWQPSDDDASPSDFAARTRDIAARAKNVDRWLEAP